MVIIKFKNILNVSLSIYAALCIAAIYYYTLESEGGLQFGNLSIVAFCLLLALPLVLWELFHSDFILRVLTSCLIVSLVILNITSQIVSNHVLQMVYYLGFIFMLLLSKFLARSFKFTLEFFVLGIGSSTTYLGIQNWQTAIYPGEERLWRSIPWHNPSGIIASMLMFASIGLMLKSFKNRKMAFLALPVYFGLTLLFALELYLSGSRGAILLSIFALLVYIVVNLKENKKLLGISVLLMLAILPAAGLANSNTGGFDDTGEIYMGSADSEGSVASTGLLSRSSSATGNFTSRIRYWNSALNMFIDSPLKGQGLGSWESVIWKFRAPGEDLSTATHNDFLQALAEGGLLLFIPFVLLILYLFTKVFNSLRRKFNDNKSTFYLQSSVFAGLIVFILHSNMDFNSRYYLTWYISALLLGWIMGNEKLNYDSLPNSAINNDVTSLDQELEIQNNQPDIDRGIFLRESKEFNEENITHINNLDSKDKWYKLEKNRNSKIIVPLMISALFAGPALLVINTISLDGKGLDNYRNYSAQGIKVPMLDPSTAFNSTIVLNNAYELSNKKLYNLAILELQLGQKYNPGDSRLKLYELLIESVVNSKASKFEPYLFTEDGHYWPTGYLNVLWMYSVLGDKDNFKLYLDKLDDMNYAHLGWEFYANQNAYYLNSLLYEVKFGDGCSGSKAKTVMQEAEEFMKAGPKHEYLRAIKNYNSVCNTNFNLN
jgi:O-antigen ligase